MKLWQIEDGVTHWVGAETKEAAYLLWYGHLRNECQMGDSDIELNPVIRELDETVAGNQVYFSDPAGPSCSMWQEFQRDLTARYIACSEYC